MPCMSWFGTVVAVILNKEAVGDQRGIIVCLPEEPGLLVCTQVTFHALKAAQAIMECLCCRMDC